jgi:hypothetical protein
MVDVLFLLRDAMEEVIQVYNSFRQAGRRTGHGVGVGVVDSAILDRGDVLPAFATHDFVHSSLAHAGHQHDVVGAAFDDLLLADLLPAVDVGKGVLMTFLASIAIFAFMALVSRLVCR